MEIVKSVSTLLTMGAVLVGCGGHHGKGVETASELKDTSSSEQICLYDHVPAGWVITAHENWPLCPLSSGDVNFRNAEIIEVAEDGMAVCDDSPIPAGFQKGAAVRSTPCVIPIFAGPSYTNAWVLKAN